MGCITRISAGSITLLPRLHRTVSDTALLCARSVLTDAASEIKPAELKKTGGERRQTDVLRRGSRVCCAVSSGLKWSSSQRGKCMWGLRRRTERRMRDLSNPGLTLCVRNTFCVCVCVHNKHKLFAHFLSFRVQDWSINCWGTEKVKGSDAQLNPGI